ncbi:MAG: peptide deformylase [Spirochaetota bacterium]
METQIHAPQDWLRIIPQMRLLTIESAEDEKSLRNKSLDVTVFGKELDEFCLYLVEQMHAKGGIGLAAPQMGIFQRVFVSQTNEEEAPLLIINPEIEPVVSEKASGEEGCLSVPGIYADVPRWPVIDITARNPYGKTFQFRLEGMDAICFQHENDHLEGVLFTDHLSRTQLKKIRKHFADQLSGS